MVDQRMDLLRRERGLVDAARRKIIDQRFASIRARDEGIKLIVAGASR